MTSNRIALALTALALSASPALAQDDGPGGVASSGMGQGQARITARSDVRLSMESMPGTSGSRVSALGSRVGARMTQLRTCYDEVVAERPTVRGALRLRLLLEERGAPNVEVDRDTANDAPLTRCVTRELGRVDVSGLVRPTHAIVNLEMANSAARGAETAAVRAQQAQQVTLTRDADGNPTASGGTPDGHVRFTAIGSGAESGEAVAAAYRATMSALPGLMDCRRRSGRRNQSPEGDVHVQMSIYEGRPPTSRVLRCTVASDRARACVSRTLRRIERRADSGRGAVRVNIHFADAETVQGQ